MRTISQYLLLLLFLWYPKFVFPGFFNDSCKDSVTINIVGVGDIMPGTNFPSAQYLPPGDNPNILIKKVKDYVAGADLSFGNLEGAFLNSGKVEKKCRDTTKCYAFRIPEKYVSILEDLGIDLVSLANNHIGDFGLPAKEKTMYLLDSLGIGYAGLEGFTYDIIKKDSITYGFCAFAPNKGTISIHDTNGAKAIVGMLEDSCDIVIVSFHGGAEGAKYEHVLRKEEMFYGENRGNVYEFAHAVVDAGADIVFGHGPHVTRSIDVYKNRMICYSLGNFFTYGRFNLNGPNGIAPVLSVHVNRKGEFLKGQIYPVYQTYRGDVLPDPQKRVIKRLQELLIADFPEVKITIDDNGNILYLH